MTPRPATRDRRPSTSPRSNQLEQLEAEALLQRNRLALYKRRVLTGKPSSATRLEELKRTSVAADARLAHAKLKQT